MGIAVPDTVGVGKQYPPVEILGIGFCILAVFDVMDHWDLGELVNQLMCGVKRCCGTLCDIGDPDTTQSAQCGLRLLSKFLTVKADRAATDAASRPNKVHRGKTQRGFPRARFPDQTKDLSPVEIEIKAFDDFMPDLIAFAIDLKVTDF